MSIYNRLVIFCQWDHRWTYYHDLNSRFRSNTEIGFSKTNGSIRSACNVAHSIHASYSGCLSALRDRVLSAYAAINRRNRSARSHRVYPGVELLQFLLFFLDVLLELCPFLCSLLLLGLTLFALFFPTPQ